MKLEEFYTCNEGKTLYKVKELHERPGLTEVTYNSKLYTLKITVSSKLLQADHLRLISRNTLPTVYGILDGLGLFTVTWEDFCQAEVHRADVTADVPCTAISEALTSLQAYSSRLYGVEDPYKTRSGQKTSLAFEKKCKTKVNYIRFSAYDKLEKLRKDTAFLEGFTSQHEYHNILDQAANLLRVEASLRSFKMMRKYFNTHKNTLQNLINSQEKVIYNIMEEITTAAPISRASNTSHGPIDPLQLDPKELPLYATLKLFEFDMPALRAYYKAKCARNAARQVKPFEELYANLQPHNPGPTQSILEYLNYTY